MIHTDTSSTSTSRMSAIDPPGSRCLPEALASLRGAKVALVRFEYAGQADYRRAKPVTFHEVSGQPTLRGISRATRQEVDVFFHEAAGVAVPRVGRGGGVARGAGVERRD